MRYRFSILILLFGLLISNQIISQEQHQTNKTKSSPALNENRYYIEKLGLVQNEATEFENINRQYEKNIKALNIKAKNKKSIKKLKALEKERDKAIKALLSEEQFKNYIELRREKRNSLKTLIRKSNGN